MRSLYLSFLGVALAEETCSDGTCSQDEATLLQMQGLRKHKHLQEPDADGVLNRDTQCWGGNQCNAQGGECPSGYCGDGGVCCRANWNAVNDQEELECGATGYGNNGMHQCQPRLLNEGQQCWGGNQCSAQGGRCQNYCGARGVCCRLNWTASNDKEREECGENGHGNTGMHQCHLPPSFYNFAQAGGGNTCPGGSDVGEADCLEAAQSLLAQGQTQGRSHLVAGSWGWVPPGCSVQTHSTHGQDGDFAAHYNNGNGNNDGGYTKVCAMPCQHLHNQDVVAGTFAHYDRDYSNSPSDEECSSSCTADPECTAWVRQPSTGRCWISRQAVVTFEGDSDRTTGLRCN